MNRLAILAVAVLGTASCSLVFTKGPSPHRNIGEVIPPGECTTGRTFPSMDGMVALAGTGVTTTTAYVFTDRGYWDGFEEHQESERDLLTKLMIGGFAVSVVYAVSASIGNKRIDGCRDYVRAGIQTQIDSIRGVRR